MLPTISFFPTSLPDETLHSRVSRYHFLSGNTSQYRTYKDLFGTVPFRLEGILPKQVDKLVQRLPSDPRAELESIIKQNTLVPLFVPFLGLSEKENEQELPPLISSSGRVPRRAIGDHGDARLCLMCVEQDAAEHGVAYWHRAHQAPFVTSCWKHDVLLMRSCPVCFRPFLRNQQLLTILWMPCDCGWECESAQPRQNENPNDHHYAVLTRDLLESGIMSIDAEILAISYRLRALQLGYRYGSNVSHRSLIEAIEVRFGTDFVSQRDRAYSQGKMSNWIRFSTLNNCLDMPVSRHVMLIMFLFEDVSNFKSHLDLAAASVSSSKYSKNEIAELTKTKQLHREKILSIRKRWPELQLEGFWRKAFTTTTWLYDHDSDWLRSVADPNSVQLPSTAAKDAEYAKIISNKVDSLYSTLKKPARVGIECMLKLLPKKIVRGRQLPIDYPLVQLQLERHLESRWHFHLRRILWGIAECARLDLEAGIGNLSQLTGINATRCGLIVNYYDIDLTAVVSARFDPQFELSKLSVSNLYEGPPEAARRYGGRGYQMRVSPE